MNSYYIAAAILIFLIALAHSLLGEMMLFSYIFNTEFFASPKRLFIKRVLRFAWHLTTTAWWCIAIILYAAAIPNPSIKLIAGAISISFFASFLLALVITRGKHLSWIVFLAISILTWIGSR